MGFDPFCSCDLGQVASHGSYPHREIAPSRLMIQAVRVKVSAPGTEGKLVLFCFFFSFSQEVLWQRLRAGVDFWTDLKKVGFQCKFQGDWS